MDPGTALAVVSLCGQLFGACVQGYDIFSNAQNFGADYDDFRWNLDTQRIRLVKWVKEWGITESEGNLHRKLNPEDCEYRHAVATLARISGLFANLKNLDSMYGIHVDQRGQRCSNPSDSRATKSGTTLRLRTSRWVKSFLEENKSLVSHHRHNASTSGSSSHISPSSSPMPGGIPGIDTDIIAHLENPAVLETKVLLPSLADEINSLSNATAELQKILPTYNKFRWAISDRGKFEKLVQQLSKYNDGLYDILPPPNSVTGSIESKLLSTARNQHYLVPHNSTLMFTGRSDVLEQMHQYFSSEASSDTMPCQQRRFVLFGMGGCGKTQIAVRYAEVYRNCFWAILWVDSTSDETAEKSFCDIARVAKVEGNLRSAKQWLTSLEEEWLLIIDNADDPALDISKYFPSGSRGNILLTTRNRDCWKYGPNSYYETKEMDEDDAITLLLRASQSLSDGEARKWAVPIVKELGFLALAIDQAGAYIASSCEISEYLDIYKRNRKGLLLRMPVQGAHSYKWTVYTTWELAFRRVQEENPVAADILQIFAFLHHEGISEEIIQRASIGLLKTPTSETTFHERLVRILQDGDERSWNSFHFRRHVEPLLRFSLVRREKNVYSVHPLVHSWARDRLKRQEREPFVKFALCLLSSSITWKFQSEDYAFRRQLVSHIDACRMHSTDLAFNWVTDSKQGTTTALKFGMVYKESGRWKEAERSQVQAVEEEVRTLGEENSNTLTSMAWLASTYRDQGRWEEAVKLEERVVETRKRVSGKEHPRTLESMGNLALTYRNQGRWEEAEKIQKRVLEAKERILGKEHLDTLAAMENLAMTYRKQGRWEEKKEIEERVLGARERILGKEHPRTLVCMANLALTYSNLGRLEEAEKLGERVIEAKERIFGKEHPETLASIGNLATTYTRQGRYEEAQKIEERVVEVRERICGKEHPRTLISLANLARTCENQGRYDKAEKMFEHVVEASERVLGKQHPDTLEALNSLTRIQNSGQSKKLKEIEVRAAEESQ